VRICIVYDCLFPYTVGGAERWYRNLSERLAAAGHEVTYLTLRQWAQDDEAPEIDGVRVIAVGPQMALYANGRRRIAPPLRFGAGVLWHLLRHGRRYDVVHTGSFPYFSLLAAALARRLGDYRLVADWHEVWPRDYWREYLGRAGWVGIWVQHRCARVHQQAFCFSRLHARRLQAEGLRGEVEVLGGEYAGSLELEPQLPAEPLVVFAGRHIREKRAPVVVSAVAIAAQRVPALHGVVYGDGPERDEVLRRIAALPTPGLVSAPGFVSSAELHDGMRRACCMLLPSRREGHSMIVVEALACGTPSIIVPEDDNAAVELVEDGVNGVVAASASAEDLADAIVRVHEAGEALRNSTRDWWVHNAERLSLTNSLKRVVATYERA
jgi:glycosyltransferase involved in cell wall biosynthesis